MRLVAFLVLIVAVVLGVSSPSVPASWEPGGESAILGSPELVADVIPWSEEVACAGCPTEPSGVLEGRSPAVDRGEEVPALAVEDRPRAVSFNEGSPAYLPEDEAASFHPRL